MKIIRNFLSFSLLIYFAFQSPLYAQTIIPSGFNKIESDTGVELWKGNALNPYEAYNYVQIVRLDQGASINLLHGTVVDPGIGTGDYGGNNPKISRENIQQAWVSFSESTINEFCIVNGQFFKDKETPTELAFPVKINGDIFSTGYGEGEIHERLLLEIWLGRADIIDFDKKNGTEILNTTAPNAIVGLSEHAAKYGETDRTFVGVADANNDGIHETVLIFSSMIATQAHAADTLRSFGADKVMMLDGGSSTALSCDGRTPHIPGERTIPQTLAVLSGDPGENDCKNTSHQYSGTLNEDEVDWHPNGKYYYSNILGKHIGHLSGPSNANFDLYLIVWDESEEKWIFIAHSLSSSSTENIDYDGSRGYYSWGVYARSGSGSYSLSVNHPDCDQ